MYGLLWMWDENVNPNFKIHSIYPKIKQELEDDVDMYGRVIARTASLSCRKWKFQIETLTGTKNELLDSKRFASLKDNSYLIHDEYKVCPFDMKHNQDGASLYAETDWVTSFLGEFAKQYFSQYRQQFPRVGVPFNSINNYGLIFKLNDHHGRYNLLNALSKWCEKDLSKERVALFQYPEQKNSIYIGGFYDDGDIVLTLSWYIWYRLGSTKSVKEIATWFPVYFEGIYLERARREKGFERIQSLKSAAFIYCARNEQQSARALLEQCVKEANETKQSHGFGSLVHDFDAYVQKEKTSVLFR